MAAELRGESALEAEPPAVRRALARAIASGALGPGRRVRLDGDAVVFDGVRLEVAGGRIRWRVAVGELELWRVAQAAVIGAAASVATAIWCGFMLHRALPAGATIAVAWAAVRILLDRRRVRREIESLIASLPLLVDG